MNGLQASPSVLSEKSQNDVRVTILFLGCKIVSIVVIG